MIFTSQCALFSLSCSTTDPAAYRSEWKFHLSKSFVCFQMFSASDLAWVNVSQCLSDHLLRSSVSWSNIDQRIPNVIVEPLMVPSFYNPPPATILHHELSLTISHVTWNKDPCPLDGSTSWGFLGCSHYSFMGIGVAGWIFKYTGGTTKPHQHYTSARRPDCTLNLVAVHQPSFKRMLTTENGILMILWLSAWSL